MDKNRIEIEHIAEKFKQMQVEKAGPTHCSGKEAEEIFRRAYKDNFVSVKAGDIMDV